MHGSLNGTDSVFQNGNISFGEREQLKGEA